MLQQRILGIARCEQHLDSRSAPQHFVGKLPTVHRARHDDIGEKQVEFRPAVGDGKRFEAFGWFAQEINGHDLNEILRAFDQAKQIKGKPSVIVARTIKGYPIQTILTSDPNHHGKPLTKAEMREIGEAWAPFRSVATWYLWRSLDPVSF